MKTELQPRPIFGPQHAEAIVAGAIWREFLAELKRNGAWLMTTPKGKN